MSAFTHGFNHGFMHGMFNNMFSAGWYNPFVCWNSTPMFFTPSCNFGGFYQYQTPMPTVNMSVFNYNTPSYNSNFAFNTTPQVDFSWQKDFSKTPERTPDWGDMFVRSKRESKSEENKEKIKTRSKNEKVKTAAVATNLAGLKGKHWSELTDTQLRTIYGDYSRDITQSYSGTAESLNKYLKGKGVLEGKGQAFIDAQNKYGISASVLVGICMNESAKGSSKLAKNKNNVGGVRISGSTKFRTFESVDACIMEMARFLKTGYVDNSDRPLTKLYQVNAKYCPTSDLTDKSGNNGFWAKAVDKYANEVETVNA